MTQFSYVEFLNKLIRNEQLKYSDINQLSSAQISAGMDGFWGFIDTATKDIGDSLYDGIKNFGARVGNVDASTVASLSSMAQMVAYEPVVGQPTTSLPKELSKLQDKMSVSRYVYDKVLSEEIIYIADTTAYADLQSSGFTGDVYMTVDTDNYIIYAEQTSSNKSCLDTVSATLPSTTWFYENLDKTLVRDASNNSYWPFQDSGSVPQISSSSERLVENNGKFYISNLKQLPWRDYVIFKYHQFFMKYFDFSRDGDNIYIDPNMRAWENIEIAGGDVDGLTFSPYEEWPVVATYKTENAVTVDIKNMVMMLDTGEYEWDNLLPTTAQACILSIQANIDNMLYTAARNEASYSQWRNIATLTSIIETYGFAQPQWSGTVAKMIELNDTVQIDGYPSKEDLVKAAAKTLTNYAMGFQLDRQLIRQQAATYLMSGTEKLICDTIGRFISDEIGGVNEFGVELINKEYSEPSYVFNGAVNIVRWFDTVNYENIAQRNELFSSGKPKPNNQLSGYTKKYFASILGYPYSATDTDTTWAANTSIPEHVRIQASSLSVSTTLQARYWEDDSLEYPAIPWANILAFYRSIGVDEKDWTAYAPYTSSNTGLLIEGQLSSINGIQIAIPKKLLAPEVIDFGLANFPDIENDDAATIQAQLDRGLFYYIMYIHQLGAAKGKADIDTMMSSTTWEYYISQSAAKQNTSWFMSLGNVNHPSFKPVSYIVSMAQKVVERFTTESIQLLSFPSNTSLNYYLQTAISSTGLTIDSWRNDNIDWAIYSTYQELSDATTFDGLQSKYIGMDGPWSLKFLHALIVDQISGTDFDQYWTHLNISTEQRSAVDNYFQNSGKAFFTQLSSTPIISYAIMPDGMSLTQFSGGDIIIRPHGWVCGAELGSDFCNSNIADTQFLDFTELSKANELYQPLSKWLVALPSSQSSSVSILQYIQSTPALFTTAGSFSVLPDVFVTASGQWIGIIDDIQQTSGIVQFNFQWFDTKTGKSSAAPVLSTIQTNGIGTGPCIFERFKNSAMVGMQSSGGWTVTQFDFSSIVNFMRILNWNQISGFDGTTVSSMRTCDNIESSLVGQILETNTGTAKKWVLPMTASTSNIMAMSDISIQYGNYYTAYNSDNIYIAQKDGYLRGIFPTLELVMDNFQQTTFNSLGINTTINQNSSITLDTDIVRIPSTEIASNKNFDYVTIYKSGIVYPEGSDMSNQYNEFLTYDESTNTLTTGIDRKCLFINDFIYNFNLEQLDQTSSTMTMPFGALKNSLDSDWGLTAQVSGAETLFTDFRYYNSITPYYFGFWLQYRQYATGIATTDLAGNSWMMPSAPLFDFYTLETIPYSTRVINSSSKMSNSNLFSLEIENANLSEAQREYITPKITTIINNLKAANTQLLDIVWKGN